MMAVLGPGYKGKPDFRYPPPPDPAGDSGNPWLVGGMGVRGSWGVIGVMGLVGGDWGLVWSGAGLRLARNDLGMILNLFWLDSGLILGTPVALPLRGHAWKQDQRPSEAERGRKLPAVLNNPSNSQLDNQPTEHHPFG